jgi:hypothetical protein
MAQRSIKDLFVDALIELTQKYGIQLPTVPGFMFTHVDKVMCFLLQNSTETQRTKYSKHLISLGYDTNFNTIESLNQPDIIKQWMDSFGAEQFFEDYQIDTIHKLGISAVYQNDFKYGITIVKRVLLDGNLIIDIPRYCYKLFLKHKPDDISILFHMAARGNKLNEMKKIYNACIRHQNDKDFSVSLNVYLKYMGSNSLTLALLHCNKEMLVFLVKIQPPTNIFTKREWVNLFTKIVESGRFHMARLFTQLCRHLRDTGFYPKKITKHFPDGRVRLKNMQTIIINTLLLGHIPSITNLFIFLCERNKSDTKSDNKSDNKTDNKTDKKIELCVYLRIIEEDFDSLSSIAVMFPGQHPVHVNQLKISRISFLKNLAKATGCYFKIQEQEHVTKIHNDINFGLGCVMNLMESYEMFDPNVLRLIRVNLITDDIPLLFPSYSKYINTCNH